jgi:hypothetical protein
MSGKFDWLDDLAAEPNGASGATALDEAQRRYREAGLHLPPVPRELAETLMQQGAWEFGTEPRDLTDRAGFLADAQRADAPPEIGFGHVGHGTVSWWLCYRLILDPLAVFLCQGFGGVYGDVTAQREIANRTLERLPELIVIAEAARTAGRLPAPERLVVVIDDRGGSGWCVNGGGPDWQDSDDALTAALDWLG